MTERITLEVSESTVRRAKKAAQQTNRPLEVVLSDWLEQASVAADISPLDPHVTYRIDTLFGAEATAQSLLDILHNAINDGFHLDDAGQGLGTGSIMVST